MARRSYGIWPRLEPSVELTRSASRVEIAHRKRSRSLPPHAPPHAAACLYRVVDFHRNGNRGIADFANGGRKCRDSTSAYVRATRSNSIRRDLNCHRKEKRSLTHAKLRGLRAPRQTASRNKPNSIYQIRDYARPSPGAWLPLDRTRTFPYDSG